MTLPTKPIGATVTSFSTTLSHNYRGDTFRPHHRERGIREPIRGETNSSSLASSLTSRNSSPPHPLCWTAEEWGGPWRSAGGRGDLGGDLASAHAPPGSRLDRLPFPESRQSAGTGQGCVCVDLHASGPGSVSAVCSLRGTLRGVHGGWRSSWKNEGSEPDTAVRLRSARHIQPPT